MTNEATLFAQAIHHIENKNYHDAEQCFLKLVDQNNVHAQINLATLYLDPHAGLKKHQEALDLLIDAVNKDHGITATNSLGMMYMVGLGVKKDLKTAYYWFTKGADAHIAACMVNMGKLNLIGIESGPNIKAAIECFIKSHKHGYPHGLNEVASLISTANKKITPKAKLDSLIQYAKLCYIAENEIDPDHGDGNLEYDFAEMLDQITGHHSFKHDAYNWYLTSHQKGNVLATNNMGAMHLKGELGGTDLKAALSFFKQAAEKGHNHAMKNLGCCYLEGIGSPINIQTAIHWLQQSVDKGCEQAIPALGFAYYSQDPHNSGRYLELMEKACQLDHPESLYLLGEIYLDGDYVPANEIKGIHLLERASELNSTKASLLLGLYYTCKSQPPQYQKANTILTKVLEQSHWDKGHLALIAELYHNNHKELGTAKAIQLNQHLADLGDAEAQARLASIYLEAQDENKDPIQAFKYASLSAKQKNPRGLSLLLAMYLAGDISDSDLLNEVITELDVLSKNGSAVSAFTLARFYQAGSKYIQQDKHLFMEYLSRAAKLGFMPAIDEMKKIPKN